MKIRSVGAELFHWDGRTDRHDEAAFRNFANAPKMTTGSITTFSMGCMSEGLGVRSGKDICVLFRYGKDICVLFRSGKDLHVLFSET